jgi:hypothetical protein
MKRYLDPDALIEELNQVYKGSMADMAIMPMGVESWLDARAKCIPETPEEYRPDKSDIKRWDECVNALHRAGDLNATIKELAVIIDYNETNHLDHLQTECYQRALNFLNLFAQIIGADGTGTQSGT